MFAKIVILACALAACNAGYLNTYSLTPTAITSTSDNILRTPGNLAQISTQSKTIATPFSTSSKSDIRVTNPGIYTHAAPLAYAAHAAPLAYAAHAAPLAYTASAAPLAYAAPAAAAGHSSLLGVAYSPAVAVSHMTYSSPYGISYSY